MEYDDRLSYMIQLITQILLMILGGEDMESNKSTLSGHLITLGRVEANFNKQTLVNCVYCSVQVVSFF